MRAWVLNNTEGPSSFELVDHPTPECGPDDVRVHLKASGLNHLDLWVSMGLPGPKHFPHIAGGDGAGVINAVGSQVVGVEVGDEVVIDPSVACGQCEQCAEGNSVYCPSYAILGEHINGTLAEQVVVPARNVSPKPAGLSWAQAGTFALTTGTAYRMLTRARTEAGSKVLVVGIGGGVSSIGLQLALNMGADVWVTSRDPEKIERAVAMGAQGGFNSASEFARSIKQETGGVDVVLENVGGATWNQSVRSLRSGGRLVTCGSTAGSKVEITVPYLFFKQLEIIGSSMYTPSEFAAVLELVSSGTIVPAVDSEFSFDALPGALAHLEQGAQFGKIAMMR
jgi:NADPH:quinone reductase-like Zn-dependent oxidoreductase